MPRRIFKAVPVALAALVAAALGGLCASAASARMGKVEIPALSDFYGQWLEAASPFLDDAEIAAYSALESDRQRDLFMHAFWQARLDSAEEGGPRVDAALWWRRFANARRRLGGLAGDRARALMIAGPPARIQIFGGCRGVLRPLRVWRYDAHQARALGLEGADRAGFDLVFLRDYDAADGLFRSWAPGRGLGELSESDTPWQRRNLGQILSFARERSCFRTGAAEERVMATALRDALDLDQLAPRVAPGAPRSGWLEAFARDLEAGALALPGDRLADSVAVGFPGRDASKLLMVARMAVPTDALRRGAAGQLFDRLVLIGELRLGSHVAQRFEQVYHLMGPPPTTEALSLDLYRRLRPGTYQMRLRLEDSRGLAILRKDLELRVPTPGDEPRITDDLRPEGAAAPLRELTRKRVVSLVTFPGLEILPLAENPVGEVEVRLVTVGSGARRVEVSVDGGPPRSDDAAPFAVRLDFGDKPAEHRIEATAFDAGGRAVAQASYRVRPEKPLKVALSFEAERGELVARVEAPPEDEGAVRVDFFLDDALIAVREEPPYRAALPAGAAGARGFARAVARAAASGESSEDLLVLDPAGSTEKIQVRWIETYATVLDASGRPVTGLGAGDFRLQEEGEERPLERFDAVENLPLQVILAMDTSVSMRDRLETAVDSARRFFKTVLTEKDQAALLTFNHDLSLAVPFTSQVARLQLGASGLDAWGGTRLFDAVVFAGGYIGGHEGRRALVLLSDGSDVESTFGVREARENALRAGLAVYPILIGTANAETRSGLESLARSSGGRLFTIRGTSRLDEVYRQIEEELRSQYLLVHRVEPGGEPGAFRRLVVETTRPGLRVRSTTGYYR